MKDRLEQVKTMDADNYIIGEECAQERISFLRLKEIYKAARDHPAFIIRGFSRIQNPNAQEIDCEILLLDCQNDSISSKPVTDIRYIEPIAVICNEDDKEVPKVKALRRDFPRVIHINQTPEGEPIDLCLYHQSWSEIRMGWSGMQFLNRILWWMAETSKGNLHQSDQAIEHAFFETGLNIVVPIDFSKNEDEVWTLLHSMPVDPENNKEKIFLRLHTALSSQINFYRKRNVPGQYEFYPLIVKTKPHVHGAQDLAPQTLGDLHDYLKERGIDLWNNIKDEIHKLYEENPKLPTDLARLLLLIDIPGKRNNDSQPEPSSRHYAFMLMDGIGKIGLENQVIVKKSLTEKKGEGFNPIRVLFEPDSNIVNWRSVIVVMGNIIREMTVEQYRLFNMVTSIPAENPVIVGCGSLGSHLLSQWTRMGWSNWTIIDNDVLYPHNVTRHVLFEDQLGCFKAQEMSNLCNAILPTKHKGEISALCIDALEDQYKDLKTALEKADFILDVSTTLSIPRSLSKKEVCRCASIFVTPSGKDSVLMLEDKDRKYRLDRLEAQYYRWIMNSEPGIDHLDGHDGSIRYGGGCREISNRIPLSSITLHSGIICQQLLNAGLTDDAVIRIWQSDIETGSVINHRIDIQPVCTKEGSDWRINWDEEVIKKAERLRKESLPVETGGIILGYVDRHSRSIYIVDINPAPNDSKSSLTAFQRGLLGVFENVNEAKNRTANIVSYLGEWHSHPEGTPPHPSASDLTQLAWTRDEMSLVGQPGIILIMSGDEYAFFID